MKTFKQLVEHIVKSGGGYKLLSHKGKNLGKYASKAGAEKREREVEYFKHMKESVIPVSKADNEKAKYHDEMSKMHDTLAKEYKHHYPITSSLHSEASRKHETARFAHTEFNSDGKGNNLIDKEKSVKAAEEASNKTRSGS